MAKEVTILSHQMVGDDAIFEVQFESFDKPVLRTIYVSNDGLSRHVDRDNLDKCLQGELSMSNDCIFMHKQKAIYDAHRLMDAKMISNHFKSFLERKIKIWGDV